MNTRRVLTASASFLALALCLSLALPSSQDKKPASAGAAGTYQIDTVHSSVVFRIKHMNASYFYGRFNEVSGSFTLDPENPTKSSANVSIAIDSVDTASEKRDDHLKSSDFFDAAQFTTATFKSQNVQKKGDKYSVEGELDLHGVKKKVAAEFELVGASEGQRGAIAGFHGTLTIKRSDFGISFMPEGLGEEVQIMLGLEGKKSGSGAR